MAKKGRYVYDWPRPMVTVDAAVFNISGDKIKMLLINRGNEPFKGKWALPGGFVARLQDRLAPLAGFVEMEEELEDAVVRELAEETGLTGVKLEQMHTFGTIGRDPRGRMITIVFMGIVNNEQTEIKAGDDAAKARWFDIENLPENMAFDHNEVLKFAIKKLKAKKSYE